MVIDQLLDRAGEVDHDLFQAILDEVGQYNTVRRFRHTPNYKIFVANQGYVETLVNRILDGTQPTRVVIVALKRMLVGLLIADMKLNQIPITIKGISHKLADVEAIFESNFPSYLKNGWQGLILKSLERGGVDEKSV